MFSWRDLPARPLVVAHRGSSSRAPENTMAAFRQAIAEGADAIELDAQLTLDGEIVVIHDFTLTRTTGRRSRVAATPLPVIRTLAVRNHGRHPGEAVPLLDEVFDLVGGSFGINIELKIPPHSRRGREFLEKLVKTIRAHKAERSSLITSFHHRVITQLGRMAPAIPCGILLNPWQALLPLRMGGRGAIDVIVAGRRSVTASFVDRCHRKGWAVGAFTVNTANAARRLRACGADFLVTDDPAKIRKALSSS